MPFPKGGLSRVGAMPPFFVPSSPARSIEPVPSDAPTGRKVVGGYEIVDRAIPGTEIGAPAVERTILKTEGPHRGIDVFWQGAGQGDLGFLQLKVYAWVGPLRSLVGNAWIRNTRRFTNELHATLACQYRGYAESFEVTYMLGDVLLAPTLDRLVVSAIAGDDLPEADPDLGITAAVQDRQLLVTGATSVDTFPSDSLMAVGADVYSTIAATRWLHVVQSTALGPGTSIIHSCKVLGQSQVNWRIPSDVFLRSNVGALAFVVSSDPLTWSLVGVAANDLRYRPLVR